MKMRRFFQGSGHEDEDSQESAAVATLEPEDSTEPTEEPSEPEETVEAKVPIVSVRDESSANRMRAAFAGVAQAVDGEVESLRRSLAELERNLNRTVDGEKKSRTVAVDGAKRELSSKIDEVVSGREKIVQQLKQSAEQERKRVDGCMDAVKQAAGREQERVDGRLDEVKAAIEQTLHAKVDNLSGQLDALGKKLHALQLDLQRQTETSQRVTAVLNNMAGVLSGNQTQPSPATASAASAEPGDQVEVDDVLERVFK